LFEGFRGRLAEPMHPDVGGMWEMLPTW
jgi:hypothetical protein